MCNEHCDCHLRCPKCGKLKTTQPYSYPYATYPYGQYRPAVWYGTSYPVQTYSSTLGAQPLAAQALNTTISLKTTEGGANAVGTTGLS